MCELVGQLSQWQSVPWSPGLLLGLCMGFQCSSKSWCQLLVLREKTGLCLQLTSSGEQECYSESESEAVVCVTELYPLVGKNIPSMLFLFLSTRRQP